MRSSLGAQDRALARAAHGAKIGATVGLLLTVLAAVGVMVKGFAGTPEGFGALVVAGALYLGGGAVSGACIGLLLPLSRKQFGLYVITTAGAIPFFASLFYLLNGFTWDVRSTIVLLIAAPAFAIATTFAWTVLGGRRQPRERRDHNMM